MRRLLALSVLIVSALAGAGVLSGCMTSRGICAVKASGEVGRASTRDRYRISHVQERLPDGRLVDVHSDRRMRDMLDESSEMDELVSYTSGAWSGDGIPVTVTFSGWRNTSDVNWTIIPCILTLGICPYFHSEEISARVEISRDDGRGCAEFAYSERDSWKMSFILACGSIPYSEQVLSRNEFQRCGHGDVLAEPHREGLSHGIVAALSEIERTLEKKGSSESRKEVSHE